MASRRISLAAVGLCVVAVMNAVSQGAEAPKELTVTAGEFDRHDAPVEIRFEQPPGAGALELVDESGAAIPLQMIDAHRGAFMLPELKANGSRTYKIRQANATDQHGAGVEAKKTDGTIVVSIAGKPAFTYQGAKTNPPKGYAAAYKRGGYIYPVLTPSGQNITDDYPANHKHQHGIWAPWTKTEFEGRHPDFWNMGEKSGTVLPVDYGDTFGGPVCGGFVAHNRQVDLSAKPEPKDALNETWHVVAYREGSIGNKPFYQFDLQITQTCASSSPLTLEQYRYGGLGYRGPKEWDHGADKCEVLTSEGKTRANGNATRGRWVRYSGMLQGKPASIAIFNGPDDFRFPQPMRIFPDQPYFCYAPEQLGEFQIVPGKPFVQRYRFVVADGVLSPDELNHLWNDYGHPPKAGVK